MATLKAKIQASQSIVDTCQSLEAHCRTLQNEKAEWSELWKDIVEKGKSLALDGSTVAHLKDGQVTPVAALKALNFAQGRCAIMLKCQGELESQIVDLRKRKNQAETRAIDSEREKNETIFQVERTESKLRLALQQSRLFESEMTSLRVLQQTYFEESKIGKPGIDCVMLAKDHLIAELRTDIDRIRLEMKDLITAAMKHEDSKNNSDIVTFASTNEVSEKKLSVAASMSATSSLVELASSREETLILRQSLQRLKDELFELQKVSCIVSVWVTAMVHQVHI